MGPWWPVRRRRRPDSRLSALAQAEKRGGDPRQTQPDPSDPAKGRRALARHPQLGRAARPRLRPKRTTVVSHYVSPPAGSTTSCTDELGPVVPRTFLPAQGWSPDGHRENRPLGLRARTREDWDLWGVASTRWEGTDAVCACTQF